MALYHVETLWWGSWTTLLPIVMIPGATEVSYGAFCTLMCCVIILGAH